MTEELGRLVPLGGGDPIPLTTDVLTVGRRESCDICLKYTNISSIHCEFAFRNGRWTVRDMGSTNGIKVNGERTLSRALSPGDEIGIAGHKFLIQFTPSDEAALDEEPAEGENVFEQSLMEKAGLSKRRSDDRG